MSQQAPLVQKLSANVDPVAAGADATSNFGEAPFDGTVTGVEYVPNALVTGANTNTRHVDVVNKGQDGSGSTVVATLQFNSGVNAPASDAKVIPLSGTPANLTVASGDVLAFVSAHVGTGIADPGGEVVVSISRS